MLPIVVFPAPYIIAIVGAVALWFVLNLFLLRRGALNFITEIADRWYNKKIEKINHSNMLIEQGIKEDPFKEFSNTIRDANERIKNGMRKINGKDKN